MTPRRRYLTFSLRTLFIVLTALAVWLGVLVNRAHRQRDAVKAIEALGGIAYYDWQVIAIQEGRTPRPPEPAWLWRLIGNDFFGEVNVVYLAANANDSQSADDKVLRSIPYLRRLPKVDSLGINDKAHPSLIYKLVAEFPKCNVSPFITPEH
jgi:hypothetical protein